MRGSVESIVTLPDLTWRWNEHRKNFICTAQAVQGFQEHAIKVLRLVPPIMDNHRSSRQLIFSAFR